MEENVALDSTKQKKFVKSIKGIKKLIKKNEKNEVKSEIKKKDEEIKAEKPFSMRLNDGKIKKKKRFQRGLVYLSHIPHGFYEHQMTQYFKQFGVVTNARVIKSKRTGSSKGYAFVEFREPSVAQIVAETMNNYLMGKRLIKAVYIPPEKIKRKAFRKKWSSLHNPSSLRRMKLNKAFNAEKSDDEDLKKAKKLLASLNKTMKKLTALGINYDFFTPVDVPTSLLDSIIKKEKEDVNEKIESVSKKGKKKNGDQDINTKPIKSEKQINVKNAGKVNKVEESKDLIEKKKKKEQQREPVKESRKDKKSVTVDEKEQKDKEQKLKDAGVKSVEEFISLDAEDSDESCEFDSDEFEKMLQDEDESEQSNDESEDALNSDDKESSGEDESDEEEVSVFKNTKGQASTKVIPPVHAKRQVEIQQLGRKMKNFNKKQKVTQKLPAPTKKPKFEKKNQKIKKTQFKKK